MGDTYENVDDYVDALQAAIRTHQRLTDDEDLTVEIDPTGELPLVQRTLLR